MLVEQVNSFAIQLVYYEVEGLLLVGTLEGQVLDLLILADNLVTHLSGDLYLTLGNDQKMLLKLYLLELEVA